MQKQELIKLVALQTSENPVIVRKVIEGALEQIKYTLIKNEPLYIRGFGTFKSQERAAKTARNIAKNTQILVPARRVPYFKPSKSFKNLLSE